MKNSKNKKKSLDFLYRDDPLEGDLSFLFNKENIKKWKPVRFELQPKNKTVTIRMGEDLLAALKKEAEKSGIDYQKFIRLILEQAVHKAG